MTNSISKYPLLPYSQLVWETTRWRPSIYRFCATLRWKNGAKEKDRIEQAIRNALMNHPVFSMHVDWKGMHYATDLKDILQGKYHNFYITKEKDDILVHAELSRILGDRRSLGILLEDIERAYGEMPLEPDDYWEYMSRYEQQKSELHYSISHDWLLHEFIDDSVPVRPVIDRKWLMTLFPPKAGDYTEDYASIREQIQQIVMECHVTVDGVFSFAAAMAIADYCRTDNAALTWAYEGRETKEEERIIGSLHRDIPFLIRKSEIVDRESAIRTVRNQIRSGIAHSDYPYTLTAPYSKRWNYAVNVLRIEDVEDMIGKTSLPLEIVKIPKQTSAYALLDVEIVEHAETLHLRYRYSATHYKPESIQRFAALVRKYVQWLVESEK